MQRRIKKSKIYIGPANTSNVSKNFELALKEVGLKADFIPWSTNQHTFYKKNTKTFKLFDTPPFKILGKNIFFIVNVWILKPVYFIKCLFKYNTFIFIKPISFLKRNLDLYILKLLRKKTIILFLGCNERNPQFSKDSFYVCNLCQDKKLQKQNHCHELSKKKSKSQFFLKNSNYILGVKDLTDFIQHQNNIIYLPAGNIKIPYTEKDYSGKLKIVHLPSNPLVKGTKLIEPLLKRIEKEFDVEVVIKDSIWSNKRIERCLKEAHILVDSLALYSFGKLSLEAIQYGCLSLNAYPDWIAENYQIQPVISINKHNLYNTLTELIKDRELLISLAKRSQKSFLKYFTYAATGNYYKKILYLK